MSNVDIKKQFLFANKRSSFCYHSRNNAISDVSILKGFCLDITGAIFVGTVRKNLISNVDMKTVNLINTYSDRKTV